MGNLSVFRISFLLVSMIFIVNSSFGKPPGSRHNDLIVDTDKVVKTPTDGGIVENIPAKYQARYEKWKTELVATDYGRQQWDKYSNDKSFILTITVASKENQGAGTGDYLWNDQGELVGATITLGWKLDKGFPSPVYFPVMNSISDFNIPGEISNETLAATKFMHEFGHVNMTHSTNRATFQLQNKLIPDYNKILLSNGYNIKDPRLIELADKMGGTPVEVWENREYWGEANAMTYLLERVQKTEFYCSVVKKINYNVNTFAETYKARFVDVVSKSKTESGCWK
jgi:hypothetical protein